MFNNLIGSIEVSITPYMDCTTSCTGGGASGCNTSASTTCTGCSGNGNGGGCSVSGAK